MRAILLPTLSAALAIAGCDQSQPTQPNKPIRVRSEAQDQLHQLDPMNRAIGLRRAIYDSGYKCQRVDESGYVQEYKNLSMWTALCNDHTQWAIFVGPDGSAQVRRCTELAQFGLPPCVIHADKQKV